MPPVAAFCGGCALPGAPKKDGGLMPAVYRCTKAISDYQKSIVTLMKIYLPSVSYRDG
jgi:hypothetical protein